MLNRSEIECFQPEHKMQSDTKPGIEFSLVPKMLRPLANIWAPNAYIVSFKLETDEDLLLPKARQALVRYQHHVNFFFNNIYYFINPFVLKYINHFIHRWSSLTC